MKKLYKQIKKVCFGCGDWHNTRERVFDVSEAKSETENYLCDNCKGKPKPKSVKAERLKNNDI
jgi:hypothetical protein